MIRGETIKADEEKEEIQDAKLGFGKRCALSFISACRNADDMQKHPVRKLLSLDRVIALNAIH